MHSWPSISKKSLKVPKGLSEAVNRRKTDNTMAKKKGTKKTNNDQQNTTQKTKNRATLIRQIGDELRCYGKVSSSCSTSGICQFILVTNPVMNEELL